MTWKVSFLPTRGAGRIAVRSTGAVASYTTAIGTLRRKLDCFAEDFFNFLSTPFPLKISTRPADNKNGSRPIP
jgi:hypothetical protein